MCKWLCSIFPVGVKRTAPTFSTMCSVIHHRCQVGLLTQKHIAQPIRHCEFSAIGNPHDRVKIFQLRLYDLAVFTNLFFITDCRSAAAHSGRSLFP